MTIDLGYAWAALPGGEVLAFVDVPGPPALHRQHAGRARARAGGPGRRRRRRGLAAAVRRAPGRGRRARPDRRAARRDPQRPGRPRTGDRRGARAPARARAWATSRRSPSRARPAPGSTSCARRSAGSSRALPAPRRRRAGAAVGRPRRSPSGAAAPSSPARWAPASLRTGDELQLGDRTRARARAAEPGQVVRRGRARSPASRSTCAASSATEVGRGDALLTPGAWRADGGRRRAAVGRPARAADRAGPARRLDGGRRAGAPARAATPHGCSCTAPLPLRAGDRALLRDPGAQAVAAGVLVLDADPPALRRRGAAAARAADARAAPAASPTSAPRWPGAAPSGAADLAALGVPLDDLSRRARRRGSGWSTPTAGGAGRAALAAAVDAHAAAAPLDGGLPAEAARQARRPARRAAAAPRWSRAAGLETAAGPGAPARRRRRPRRRPRPASPRLEARLRADPFAAPEGPDLDALRLGARELAAAERAGRLLRLRDEVVLLPDGPARAMRVLAGLPQPFTLSQARQALGHHAPGRRAAARAPRRPRLDPAARRVACARSRRGDSVRGPLTWRSLVPQEVRAVVALRKGAPVSVADDRRPRPGSARGRRAGRDLRGLPHRPALPRGRHQRRLPVPARPRGGRAGRDGRRRRHDGGAGRPGRAGLAGAVRALPGVPARPALYLASTAATRARR